MRLVGEVADEKLAEKFVGYLAGLGIEAQVRDAAPNFGVWVFDEDKLPECEQHWQLFIQDPNARAFQSSKPQPPKISPRPEIRFTPKGNALKNLFTAGMPVTLGVIALCFVLALFSILPGFSVIRGYFYFSESLSRGFPEIREGQIWRLVTPIFLHGNPLHLLFNMLWMYQLGGEIETEEGSKFLALFMLCTAILCDVAQYLVSGPNFVGLSGVVYAFLSYIWVMSRRSSTTRYAANDQTLVFMLVWLVICLVGIIPSVANTQHIVGLLSGAAWGWLRSLAPRKRLKR